MILTGKLANPIIRKYYVTGSVQAKESNTGLQKMLQKINEGGVRANEFLNDEKLKSFAARGALHITFRTLTKNAR